MLATVQKIKEGDKKCFHDFYNEYHARLYLYIYKHTRSEWLAEETVQLSFIKIWESRESLSLEYELSTQLFRVAKSILLDLLRKSRVRKTMQLSSQGEISDSVSLENVAETKDKLKKVMTVIKSLPPVQQEVFSKSRLEDLSHKEIAKELSISPKTIETHITRAIKRLKKSFLIFLQL